MRIFKPTSISGRLAFLCASALLSGCEYLLPEGIELGQHRVSVEQGNILPERSIRSLHVGMDKKQVLFVLGTPLVRDPFHPERWEYPFFSEGAQAGDPSRLDLLSLYFNDEGQLLKIERLVRDDPDIRVTGVHGEFDMDERWFEESEASIPYPEEEKSVDTPLQVITPIPEPAPLPNLGDFDKDPTDDSAPGLGEGEEEERPFVPAPPALIVAPPSGPAPSPASGEEEVHGLSIHPSREESPAVPPSPEPTPAPALDPVMGPESVGQEMPDASTPLSEEGSSAAPALPDLVPALSLDPIPDPKGIRQEIPDVPAPPFEEDPPVAPSSSKPAPEPASAEPEMSDAPASSLEEPVIQRDTPSEAE